MRALWRRFMHALRADLAGEILDRDLGAVEVERLLIERAQAIIAATNVPTVNDCWLCESCGAIQGEATNFKCQVCGRSELVNLSPRLTGIVKSNPRVSRFNRVVR